MHNVHNVLQHDWAFILPPRLGTASLLRYHLLTVLVTQPIAIPNVSSLFNQTDNPPTVTLIKNMNMHSTIHPRPVQVTAIVITHM
jgi:hypothetical protein